MAVTDTQFFTPPTGPRGRRRQLVWRRQAHILRRRRFRGRNHSRRPRWVPRRWMPAGEHARARGRTASAELLIEVEAVACPTDGA